MVSQTGMRLLIDKIEQAKHICQAERVFVGIEATGHYYEDIVRILTEEGYSVHIITPASTHEERKQHLTYTKTDDIDLYLIAVVLLVIKQLMPNWLPAFINNFNILPVLEEAKLINVLVLKQRFVPCMTTSGVNTRDTVN
jgi:hypothetical protein